MSSDKQVAAEHDLSAQHIIGDEFAKFLAGKILWEQHIAQSQVSKE